jgi:hypothetical protein
MFYVMYIFPILGVVFEVIEVKRKRVLCKTGICCGLAECNNHVGLTHIF